MSFLFGIANDNSLKDKHISSLRSYFPRLHEEQKYKSYTVPVPSNKHPNLNLRITLEPSFPQSQPTIQLLPEGLVHPIITDRGFVKYAASNMWTLHSDLGKLVHGLVQEFQRNEPQKRGDPISNQYRPPVPHPAPQRVHERDPTLALPELEQLSIDQMTALLNDQQQFAQFINTIESLTTNVNLRNDLLKTNAEEKEKKCSLQNELTSIENEIKEQNQKVEQLRSVYNEKTRIQESIMGKLSPQSLANTLTDKAQNLDDQCEDIGDKFTRGELSLEKFLSLYLKERKDHHLCLLKAKTLTNNVPQPTTTFPSYHATQVHMGTWRPNF